jgi:hypothetical protein
MSEMSDSTSSPLYQPLNAERHEIRLLRILEQSKIIACTLEVVSLDDSPKYSALSYEWARYQDEDPGEDVPLVEVNSLPISTTKIKNLSLALKYLEKGEGPYWIDALCINQEDDSERGHQVRMMTKIYQSARMVYAWLGLSDDESALGMDLLTDFNNDFFKLYPPLLPPKSQEWASDWVKRKLLDPLMHPHWAGLGKILDNSYWNRMWIVQELVVPEAAWIMLKYGPSETSFEHADIILRDVSQLQYSEFGGVFGARSSGVGDVFSKVTESKASQILQDARSWRNKDIQEMGMLSLLRRYITSACSNPRDRAYALLGFELGKEGSSLEINYSAPLDKVFLDVAQYVIQRSQRLDILGFYHGAPHVPPLPSWAPDWQLTSTLYNSLIYSEINGPNYDASATTSTSFRFEGTVLTVRCILLGPITICSVPNWAGDFLGSAERLVGRGPLQTIICLYCCASSLCESEFEDLNVDRLFDLNISENMFIAFYETVIAEFFNHYASIIFPLPEVIKYCKWLMALLQKEHMDEPDCPVPWTEDQLTALRTATTNHLQLFSIEIQELANRTQSSDQSIVLKNPRKSIGRGDLRFAKDGDMVAIVHGCNLPILLRKEDKRFSVLSGLYVYGFMHGGAIGQYPETDIDLI